MTLDDDVLSVTVTVSATLMVVFVICFSWSVVSIWCKLSDVTSAVLVDIAASIRSVNVT